jgi:hypothetical protein
MVNMCPVCGYLMQYPPKDHHICPSCGTEFGYDDAGRTHAELRAEWLRAGANWWSPVNPRPGNWEPYIQLNNIIDARSGWVAAFEVAAQRRPVEAVGLTGMRLSQGSTPQGQSPKGQPLQAGSPQGPATQSARAA